MYAFMSGKKRECARGVYALAFTLKIQLERMNGGDIRHPKRLLQLIGVVVNKFGTVTPNRAYSTERNAGVFPSRGGAFRRAARVAMCISICPAPISRYLSDILMDTSHHRQKVGAPASSPPSVDLYIPLPHPPKQLPVVEERLVEFYVKIAVDDIVEGSSDGLSRPTIQQHRQNANEWEGI